MNLKTYYDPPPIPAREFDWSCIDSDTFDGERTKGFGRTEEEAIICFVRQLLRDEGIDIVSWQYHRSWI